MAIFLLYLGPYLGLYSILVTASLGGVCMCSCYSCYSYYRVAGAAIRVTGSAAIRITYSTAVKTANKISGCSCRYCCGYYCRRFCCKGYFRAYYRA